MPAVLQRSAGLPNSASGCIDRLRLGQDRRASSAAGLVRIGVLDALGAIFVRSTAIRPSCPGPRRQHQHLAEQLPHRRRVRRTSAGTARVASSVHPARKHHLERHILVERRSIRCDDRTPTVYPYAISSPSNTEGHMPARRDPPARRLAGREPRDVQYVHRIDHLIYARLRAGAILRISGGSRNGPIRRTGRTVSLIISHRKTPSTRPDGTPTVRNRFLRQPLESPFQNTDGFPAGAHGYASPASAGRAELGADLQGGVAHGRRSRGCSRRRTVNPARRR